MNGSLPGLLDDPQFQLASLPALTDFHIAPLRNPAPSRHANVPLPLEPVTENVLGERHRPIPVQGSSEDDGNNKTLALNETPTARELKKPQIAISELLDAATDEESASLQLPSFVSLSVVEKSPTQEPSRINDSYPRKRVRLDVEAEQLGYDMNRLLPKPPQKDGKQPRPVPLLPAMVTGLHEPPPSAALLPSMAPDARRRPSKPHNSKMQVKDILREPQQTTNSRPPELMLNTPELETAELPKFSEASLDPITDSHSDPLALDVLAVPKKDPKVRRARRKWSEQETADLLAGVKKHGFGKWKQILTDPSYSFAERTSIDLKDRFRVFAKEYPEEQVTRSQHQALETPTEQDENVSTSIHDVGSTSVPQTSISGSITRPRRKRHPWTKEEDAALLQGVNKHGFQWTDIHNDAELNLDHRRATDLRDRIRNLYPEGYKRAEARPLRRELKKAERPSGRDHVETHSSGWLEKEQESYTNSTQSVNDKQKKSSSSKQASSAGEGQKGHPGKTPSIATLTMNDLEETKPRSVSKAAKASIETQLVETNGVTLPSFDLDEPGHTDWSDNTLAPFLGWDDNIGM